MIFNNKNKFLIVTSIVLVFIAYKVAISKTFFYYHSYNSVKEKLIYSEKIKKELAFLNAKKKKLNAILKNDNSQKASVNYQNYLLKVISSLCDTHKIKIITFVEPEVIPLGKGKITHYKFSVEGNFNSVLMFLNQLENKHFVGKVKHFSTEKKMIHKENRIITVSTVVIEKK